MSTPAPIAHFRQADAGQPATLEELVARRVELKADAEYIGEQIEQIDAQLIEQLATVGTHDVGGVKVQIREYTRTDYSAIEKAFPSAEYPQLYATRTALDQDAVKRQFAPAALAEYLVHGKRSVTVK